MDTRQSFTAQIDAELESWKARFEETPREVLLVIAVAVLHVLVDKHGIRIFSK